MDWSILKTVPSRNLFDGKTSIVIGKASTTK